MYEFYQLSQQWQKLYMKQFEPAFNNPLADWYMNLWMDAALRVWFWPGTIVMIEDQVNEFAKTFSICK